MHKGWLWNAQFNNCLAYYQGRFLYAKLNLQNKNLHSGVDLIIGNNIDQNLKVEKTTKSEIKIEKCNQTKSGNWKNLLGQNMERYKSNFDFNLSNEWVKHNNIL